MRTVKEPNIDNDYYIDDFFFWWWKTFDRWQKKEYLVYGNGNDFNNDKRPSMTDTESEVNLNKINFNVDNTCVIYRHRIIIDKYINLKPTEENFKTIQSTPEKTKGNYNELNEP